MGNLAPKILPYRFWVVVICNITCEAPKWSCMIVRISGIDMKIIKQDHVRADIPLRCTQLLNVTGKICL